jgi:hypothetical protein
MTTDELQRNIEDNHGRRVDTSKLYSPWGDQSMVAQKQGWYPEVAYGDTVTYRSGYNSPFNTVQIPGQSELGHVALIGGYSGNFDVVVRDNAGKVKSTLFKGISPQQVQQWITSPDNTIAQRVDYLKKNYGVQNVSKLPETALR